MKDVFAVVSRFALIVKFIIFSSTFGRFVRWSEASMRAFAAERQFEKVREERADLKLQLWNEKAELLELEAQAEAFVAVPRCLGAPISQARRRIAQLEFELQDLDGLAFV